MDYDRVARVRFPSASINNTGAESWQVHEMRFAKHLSSLSANETWWTRLRVPEPGRCNRGLVASSTTTSMTTDQSTNA